MAFRIHIYLSGVVLWLGLSGPNSSAATPTSEALGEDGSPPAVWDGRVIDNTVQRDGVAGGGLDVVIVASAAVNIGDPWFTDPRDRLIASGFFDSVTVIHAGQSTPTGQDLDIYDAILIWSNFAFADPAALGNALADYVDAGGGVVLAVFANSSSTVARFPTGRWQSHGYEVVPPASGTTTGAASMGTLHQPGHPILSGVGVFGGGSSSYRPTTTTLIASASRVADWSDGSTLVALREDTIGSRVDLGFYPPSDLVLPNFWDDATDGGLLLANALKYAAERPPLNPGDSDGDQDVDADDFAGFESCRAIASSGPVPAGCVVFDFDRDDDVDCLDWIAFRKEWTEPSQPPYIAECAAVIPALSSWGLLAIASLILIAATLILRRTSSATV